MLVVDLNTLQAVNILNFLDQIGSQFSNASQTQDIVRRQIAFSDGFALFNVLTFEDRDMTPLRNEDLMLIILTIRHDDATLALGFLTKADGTGRFREDCRILRLARLEEVGNTRQTTGDVTRLTGFLRNTRQNVTDLNQTTIRNSDDSASRQEVLSHDLRGRNENIRTVLVDQLDHRAKVLTGTCTLFGIDDHHRAQTGDFI